MINKIIYFIASLALTLPLCSGDLYFPPKTGSTWETLSPESLDWDVTKIEPLYNFLEQQNSKAFIVLKDGKIVLEKYFGTFTKDSSWYWASAGKTITSFLVGKAQEEGFLDINDLSSKYLGVGWTNCPAAKEEQIKVWHQLTMTTGLDDGVADNHCTSDSCLTYLSDAGTRWAYHNAPYTLLEKVLISATGTAINTYTYQKLGSKTGITGLWFTLDYNNVFFSKPRNMARFGLLFQNECVWDKDTILNDKTFFRDMINTSQSLNKSYGYLWWLNGKESFMVPTLQNVFSGSYAPDAPKDMYAALGKNGQILCIAPTSGLVVVRMGDKPDDGGEMPLKLCNQIWQKLNDIMKNPNAIEDTQGKTISISPNPASDYINIFNYNGDAVIYNMLGIEVWNGFTDEGMKIDVSRLPKGVYFVRFGNDVVSFFTN